MKRLWIIVALWSLAFPAYAQVTFDQATSADNGFGTDASMTFSATVGNNLNRLLTVGCAITESDNTEPAFTGVTFNGNAMIEIAQINAGGIADLSTTCGLWYTVNPAVTTANVVVNTTPDARFACGAVSLYNVDQSTPVSGTQSTDNGDVNVSSTSLNVSSSSGDMVIDVAGKRATLEVITVGADQTQRWIDETAATEGSDVIGAGSTEPGAATNTMSWSATASRRMCQIATSINQVQVAAGQKRRPLWFQ